jgi:hypothetical protein
LADSRDNRVLPLENSGEIPFQQVVISVGSRRKRAARMAQP